MLFRCAEEINKSIRSVLSGLMTDELCMKFNLDGQGKSGKRGLRCTPLMDVVTSKSIDQCGKCLKCYLVTFYETIS